MGQMRFLVPRRERVPKDAVDRAYLAGMEYIPWQSRNRWLNDLIVIEREVDESGCLHILWNVAGHGDLVLSTTSLMERPEPYHLPVELARGTLNRIRNQLAVWEPQGFTVSKELTSLLSTATERFIRAATWQHEPLKAADEAEQTLVQSLDAIALIAQDFTNQVLDLRHQQTAKLATLLGGSLDTQVPSEREAEQFLGAFNTAVIPFSWRDVELNEGEYAWSETDQQTAWCRAAGLRVFGGPLLRFYQGRLPDWLYLWEDDFETVRSFALHYVEAAVQRYRGTVQIWNVATGMNMAGTLALPEEYRLRLAVDAIQTVVQADPTAPVVISFDQPWAEYLATEDLDLSPLHFADALVRADLGLAGLGLEINLAYTPGGTLPRELLEVNRLLDYWSHLGLPLLIFLTIPSRDGADPQARRTATPLSAAFPKGLTPTSQMELAQRLVPMLISKQCVHAIMWNQLSDRQPHDFPHGGLFDSHRNPKPILAMFADLRRTHLT